MYIEIKRNFMDKPYVLVYQNGNIYNEWDSPDFYRNSPTSEGTYIGNYSQPQQYETD
jgi:hypothetical protein